MTLEFSKDFLIQPKEEGGGGGGDTPTPDTGGEYLVRVVDYDGTILKQDHLNEGETFTLPSAPTHDLLTFQEWSSPVTITNNTVTVGKSDIIIGAVYDTKSGQSEFDIEVNGKTGLTFKLNMDGNKDWGDGTVDTNTSHTYTSSGKYTIKCDGTTMTSSQNSHLFGTSNSNMEYSCIEARISKVSQIATYAFSRCASLKRVTISKDTTSFGTYAFSFCPSLYTFIVPSTVTVVPERLIDSAYGLKNIVLPYGITSIGNYAFYASRYFDAISIPQTVTAIGTDAINQCTSLKKLTIPAVGNNLSYTAFKGCSVLEKVIYLKGTTAAALGDNCYELLEYDFTDYETVPSLGSTSAVLNSLCKIIVPASLYATWKWANSWSTYSNNIVSA